MDLSKISVVVVYYTLRLAYTWAENRPTSPLHLQKFPDYEAAFAAVVAHEEVRP